MSAQELAATIDDLVIRGKGILAADESLKTIGKRFETINLENTEEHRRQYRSLLATTPKLNSAVSGVILFEETLTQQTDEGQQIPAKLTAEGIVPGIKVDKGLVSFQDSEEKLTQGLDGLADRLAVYKDQGARFAKWRDVFVISASTPTSAAIKANAEVLAIYAATCQAIGIVPIVEPEVLMDGAHDIARARDVTDAVLKDVFAALQEKHVALEHIVLKPNMVVPGKTCADQASPEAIAEATLAVLNAHVPAAVPSINFLSGGQSPVEATVNLQAINAAGAQPWYISFSYGRALQEPCLAAWAGNPESINAAQGALVLRCRLNGQAAIGQYEGE
jgi:fructose-bisphosphate aldolase, class I